MYPFRIEEQNLYKQYPQKIIRKVERVSPAVAGHNNNRNRERNHEKKSFNMVLEEELSKFNTKC